MCPFSRLPPLSTKMRFQCPWPAALIMKILSALILNPSRKNAWKTRSAHAYTPAKQPTGSSVTTPDFRNPSVTRFKKSILVLKIPELYKKIYTLNINLHLKENSEIFLRLQRKIPRLQIRLISNLIQSPRSWDKSQKVATLTGLKRER